MYMYVLHCPHDDLHLTCSQGGMDVCVIMSRPVGPAEHYVSWLTACLSVHHTLQVPHFQQLIMYVMQSPYMM